MIFKIWLPVLVVKYYPKMNIKSKTILLIVVTLVITFLFSPNLVQTKNLLVPFTPQAPEKIWSQPWQDACEETSIAMVNNFYQNNTKKTLEKTEAKKDILEIFKIKEIYAGKSLDENTNKIAEMINNYLSWEAKIVKNPTLEQIKTEIDSGQPVIIPVHGKSLKNQNFKNGGPNYHMLVISGYDNDKQIFITQEPGTQYGLDFPYSFATIMDAIHDFLPYNQTNKGEKMAIFTQKNLDTSANLDPDKDGLSKKEEWQYGSISWLSDSDGDGYSDGEEVKNGYSPTKKFQKI